MQPKFTNNYLEILERIEKINPTRYSKTRNYVNGDVTYLSPYVSRGVITTKQILESVINRGYKLFETEQFVKELAWRDYFQRVWQEKNINDDIKSTQQDVSNFEIPSAIVEANCRVEGVNIAIQNLYETGYMHNHCRMYTASIVCNIAKSHWLHAAKWMYYHLLDGDWASNACSWQWVAGSNSSKKYFANQENVSKFTETNQHTSYLDDAYNNMYDVSIPDSLKNTTLLELKTELPIQPKIEINNELPTFIYNYYNVDPTWHSTENGNRILLLEPSIFKEYPINENCMNWLLSLSENINNIQIFVGEFDDLKNQYNLQIIFFKEHPLNKNYTGIEESRDWIVPEITGYYPSFFSYWKQIEKQIKKQFL